MIRYLPVLALSLIAAPAFAQQAGTLVSAEPVVETPAGTQAWRVVYQTRDGRGRPRQATGMVIAPREALAAGPRRVIAWTHGTWGVVNKCAPSQSASFFDATPALADMVRRGFVVVAPDYPGLGSQGPHPFLVGPDTARSVLDAVRAAQGIAGAGAGGRFAVWGESQGGHAALWTGAQAAGYAPDLTLVGTAAAAPPTDLAANLRQGSDANVRAMLIAYVTWSWSRFYGAPLSTLFDRAHQGVATRLAQNNCIELGKTPRIGTILGVVSVRNALKGKDIGSIRPWSQHARANSVAAGAVPGPLIVVQSGADPVVASAVTRAWVLRRCATRRPTRWVPLPGGDHAHTARDSATVTLDWIEARFAGEGAPSDCGEI